MAGQVSIDVGGARRIAEQYGVMSRKTQNYSWSMEKVYNSLSQESYRDIKRILARVMEKTLKNRKNLELMEQRLKTIADLYENTEDTILNRQMETIKDIQKAMDQAKDKPDSSESQESIWDYLGEALAQVLLGDFSKDGNALGILLSVLVGFIPVVGQISDIRDLIADVWNLIDDGPETSEWVALGLTALGFIPGLGDFLKQGDEMGTLLKNTDTIADSVQKFTGGVLKNQDELVSTLIKYSDEVGDFMDQNVYGRIGRMIDGMVEGMPVKDGVKNLLKNFLDKSWRENVTTRDVLEEIIWKFTGEGTKKWVSENIDGREEDFLKSGVPIVFPGSFVSVLM